MSDPNSTEPPRGQPEGQPVQPFDQEAAEAAPAEDASPDAGSTWGAAPSEPSAAAAADPGSPTPAPQYAPPSGERDTQVQGPAQAYGSPQPSPGGAPEGYPAATSGNPAPPQGSPGYQGAPQGYQGYQGAPQGYPGAPQGSPGYQGAPQGYPGYPGGQGYAGGPRTNPYAIASLICSLAGLITGISVIPGIVLGHIALNKIKETGEEGRPLAIAGLAVGYGLLVIGFLLIVGFVAFFALLGTVGTVAVNAPAPSF